MNESEIKVTRPLGCTTFLLATCGKPEEEAVECFLRLPGLDFGSCSVSREEMMFDPRAEEIKEEKVTVYCNEIDWMLR